MEDYEILRKAIRKCIDNGEIHFEQCLDYLSTYRIQYNEHYSLIFDKRFAKAFWGEEWRFHISEVVKCEEPLKYLEKFLQ